MVLLMLIPLLAPSDSGAAGLNKIAAALGVAAVKVLAPTLHADCCKAVVHAHVWL